jgi:hypothetical protein
MSDIGLLTAVNKIASNSDFTDAMTVLDNPSTFIFTGWLVVANRKIQKTWYPVSVVGTDPDNLSGDGLNVNTIDYLENNQLILRIKFRYDLLNRIYEIETSN